MPFIKITTYRVSSLLLRTTPLQKHILVYNHWIKETLPASEGLKLGKVRVGSQ